MSGEITTMKQLTAARTYFEKKLQNGEITQEKYTKQMGYLDRAESRIRSK